MGILKTWFSALKNGERIQGQCHGLKPSILRIRKGLVHLLLLRCTEHFRVSSFEAGDRPTNCVFFWRIFGFSKIFQAQKWTWQVFGVPDFGYFGYQWVHTGWDGSQTLLLVQHTNTSFGATTVKWSAFSQKKRVFSLGLDWDASPTSWERLWLKWIDLTPNLSPKKLQSNIPQTRVLQIQIEERQNRMVEESNTCGISHIPSDNQMLEKVRFVPFGQFFWYSCSHIFQQHGTSGYLYN